MAKVYLLTQGDYSDYTVLGVFSTLEGVEAAAAGDEDLSIEPFELDALAGHVVGDVWSAVIYKSDGKVERRQGTSKELRHPHQAQVQNYNCDRGFWVGSPISLEHAVKVAIEKRQEWLRTQPAAQ